MKRINSIDGCNERDHEFGFSIGPGTVESYFGRDIYEDRRRQYTDDESRIDDRTNLDIMDNVFCPECEKLFSKYESKYSLTYNLPFDKELVENTCVTGTEAALFWLGVIWRISATGHFGAKLNPKFEEKLRRIVLSENTNGSGIYYALHYCKDYRASNPTIALFDSKNNVALLIVDEFMIELFNGEEATHSDIVLWGMNFKCDVTKINNGIKPERIGLFPEKIFNFIIQNIFLQFVKRFDLRGKFNEVHKALFRRDIPEPIFLEVISEVRKAKLADVFTIHNYALAIKKVILAHPDIYRVKFEDD